MRKTIGLNSNGKKVVLVLVVIIIAVISFMQLYLKDIIMSAYAIDYKKADTSVYKYILDKGMSILDVGINQIDIRSFQYSWPLKGTITSEFGMRSGVFHQGIDIAAPEGTYVAAFMSGTVVYSGWEGGYGNMVVIDHGYGIKSYYGHNLTLLVTVGQVVNMNQHISEVGSTGDSTGPHCHFEIRMNGTPINPQDYLKYVNHL